ncbi:MAG: AraC family transcriptional regulator [Clostridiaceae bacterium]
MEEVFVNLNPERGSYSLPDNFSFEKTLFFEYECHKFFEVAVQIEGRCILQLNDRYYQMEPGQIVLVDRNQVHRIGFDQQGKAGEELPTMLWMNVTGDIVRSGCTTYMESTRNKTWGTDLNIPGGFLINEILTESAAKPLDEDARKAIAQYIDTFLTLLYRKLTFETESMTVNWSKQIVCELQNYIKNHLNNSLRLQELSDIVSISPSYLSRIFRQVTGQTITNYIQSIKITKALEMLADTDCALCEIAEALGYYDQFHFSKVFKSYVGSSPTAYRNALCGACEHAKEAEEPQTGTKRQEVSVPDERVSIAH